MKGKLEYIVLAVLIVGLSAYLFLRNPNKTHYQVPTPPQVNKSDITKIEITTKKNDITLHKVDDRWQIEPQGYPADASKIAPMLDALSDLTLTALVSEAKDYARYDLNPDKKIHVKAWARDKLERDFDIGKTAPSFRHTFVKLAGDARVYHARGNFHGTFDIQIDSLRDKKVLSFDQNEIKRIEIKNEGKDLILVRKLSSQKKSKEAKTETAKMKPKESDLIWQTTDGRVAQTSIVKHLLTVLSNLHCDSYIVKAKKTDYHNPIYTVILTGNEQYRLDFFAKTTKDATKYPAITSQCDYPFEISQWRSKDIMKSTDDLVKKPEQKKNREKLLDT